MRKWLPILLMVALTLLSACSGKKATQTSDGPTLDDVRRQAQHALDSSLPSKERQLARDQAMSQLVSLLRDPKSMQISKDEWEKPFKDGEPVRLHYFESGKVRAYGLTLPGSGVVPPGERVVIQYVGAGVPQAYEVEIMPGGQLAGARFIDDKSVALVYGLARGGGYVGYYQRDTDGYKPDATVFRGLPTTVGDVRLETRGNFLLVDVSVDSDWRPAFDKTHPQRFYLNADLGLEWKSGKFAVVDESDFTAFQGFVTAADPGVKKEERLDAWEKATRKLPAYLQQVESFSEKFLSRLPKGAREQMEQTANLTVRVISIPAPEGLGVKSFTVLQHRVGNGMPMATVLDLPGPVEGLGALEVEGQSGVEVLAGAESGPGRLVRLLRMTTANDWEPAPEWYGYPVPAESGITIKRGPGPADLTIEPADPKAPVIVALQPDKSILIGYNKTSRQLAWLGGRLSGGAWVLGQIPQTTSAMSAADVLKVADAVKQFLASPEAGDISAANLAALAGPGALVWETGSGSKVLAFPPNNAGMMPLLVQAGKTVLVESYSPQTVTQWVNANEVQAGGSRWLLVLGRSTASASLVVYQWSGDGWQPVNALGEVFDRPIAPATWVRYLPGQTEPIRGVYVSGTTALQAHFTPDGAGVAFCVTGSPCITYQYSNHWVLK